MATVEQFMEQESIVLRYLKEHRSACVRDVRSVLHLPADASGDYAARNVLDCLVVQGMARKIKTKVVREFGDPPRKHLMRVWTYSLVGEVADA